MIVVIGVVEHGVVGPILTIVQLELQLPPGIPLSFQPLSHSSPSSMTPSPQYPQSVQFVEQPEPSEGVSIHVISSTTDVLRKDEYTVVRYFEDELTNTIVYTGITFFVSLLHTVTAHRAFLAITSTSTVWLPVACSSQIA